MTTPVEHHYTRGNLLAAIETGLRASGKSPDTVGVEDLAPVDEFHIGGRPATEALLAQLELSPETRALDVGCGMGGSARFAHARFGCRVSGVDLTREFIEVARALSDWVGFGNALDFHCASALETPFDTQRFDAAFQLHVGMNIADKAALFAEVARVLAPGARFGVYDVMQAGEKPIAFPVPWATQPSESHLAPPADYARALSEAGFEIVAERDRSEMAFEFFARLRARAQDGPPPLGLHLVMGADAPTKIANMVANLESRRIAPVEIIARRR